MPKNRFIFSYYGGPGKACVWYREQFVLAGDIRGFPVFPETVKELIDDVLSRLAFFKKQIHPSQALLLRGLKINQAFGGAEAFLDYVYDKETLPIPSFSDNIQASFTEAFDWAWGIPEIRYTPVFFASDRFDPHQEKFYDPVREWLGWHILHGDKREVQR